MTHPALPIRTPEPIKGNVTLDHRGRLVDVYSGRPWRATCFRPADQARSGLAASRFNQAQGGGR